MNQCPVIAIDGPAASGKGTLARLLARELGFAWLDTGLLYRAVGMAVVQQGGDPSDPALAIPAAQALDFSKLMTDPTVRQDEAGQAASKCAAIPEVRAALVAFQRDFAARPPGGKNGAVLDGRDIGTVICPDAPLKLYVTASPKVRAERRHKDQLAHGKTQSLDDVLEEIHARDHRDMNRAVAPLKPAPDSVLIDTTTLDIEEAVRAARAIVKERLGL